MLSKSTTEKLQKLGINVETLVAAVKDEAEKEIDVPEGELFTTDQIAKRDKQQYDKGKKSGQEMLIDEIKELEGLEFEGKTKDNLVKAFKDKMQAETGKDIETRIKDRDKQIQGLKESLQKQEAEYKNVQTEFSNFKSDYELLTLLPENRNNALSNEEWIYRLRKNGLSIEEVEGKKIAKLKGEVIADDKTKDPLDLNAAISKIFTSNEGWLAQQSSGGDNKQPGRGFGDNRSGNGLFKSISEFKKAMDAKGVKPTNQAYQAELTKAIADYPEMDMNA